MNVVTDAILVVQARKDPQNGSQEIVAFCWVAAGVGGLIGCLIGGVLTQFCHPRVSFLLYSTYGLVVAFNGSLLTKESEEDNPEPEDSLSISSLGSNMTPTFT